MAESPMAGKRSESTETGLNPSPGQPLRLGILVSGRGSNMAAIINEIEAGRLPASIEVVVSDNPEAPALALAAGKGLTTEIIQRRDFGSQTEFEGAIIRELRRRQVQLVVLAGFLRLIGPGFLTAFPGAVINIHPSLLPAFPGLEAQKQALDYGVKITGCTVHYVNEVMDGGAVIAQTAVPVKANDTAESLSARILVEEHRLLPRVIGQIAREIRIKAVAMPRTEVEVEKIKILVVGNGAREHALVWKLSQSPRSAQICIAPGNPGLDLLNRLVPLKVDDVEGLVKFAMDEKIGLVVIGPEAPLALGLADRMAEAGLTVFGPTAEAARLESSKSYAKDFMFRHRIPTAAYRIFDDQTEALAWLDSRPDGPIVVKAAGLAQGKGVTVAQNRAEAQAAVREAMEGGRFGEAGREVVIEDCIEGEEVSLLAFTDGRTIVPMPPVQDHKRLGEGDTGPNTGGMGAYTPVAVYTPEVARQVEDTIIIPTLKGLQAEGLDYRGCLYFGLMLPSPGSPYKGPQLIEYNARFGDPETEVLMPLFKSDLVETMLACARGTLADCFIEWLNETAVCVVIASGGYPGPYQTGLVITENVPAMVGASLTFHAGTAVNERGEIVTAGGRVITVTATDKDLGKALFKAYDRVRSIHFKNSYYRRDIAYRELARRYK